MSLQTFKDLLKKDPLLFHKLGLASGTLFGLLIGLIISDKADDFDIDIIEEVTDGQEKA